MKNVAYNIDNSTQNKKDGVISEKFINSYKKAKFSNNWFLDLNPLSKLNIILGLAILPVIFQQWWVSIGIVIIYSLIAFISNKSKQFSSTFLKLAIVIGSFFFVVRALFIPGETELYSIGILSITQEGVDKGIRAALLMIVVSGLLVLISVTIEAYEFTYSLEQLGVSPKISYMILSSLQLIIDLQDKSQTIMDSQRSRGIETEGNVWIRVRAFIPVLSPLFLGAITDAEEKTIAMDARAFSSSNQKTSLVYLRDKPTWEKFMMIGVNITLLGIIVWGVIL